MKIFENYNTVRQKYGVGLVDSLTKLGLPPKYLLSACKFIRDYGITQERIVCLFKEWNKYVEKYNDTDVNKLTYEEFFNLISKEKSKHCVPNVIFINGIASLGKLNNAKDVQSIPIRNEWCIKSQKWFDKYTSKGYEFFVIYLKEEPLPFTFVIASVIDGDVEYYDSNDYEQFENFGNPKETNNSDHDSYQRKLPQEIISYLYDVAISQTERKEHKNIN